MRGQPDFFIQVLFNGAFDHQPLEVVLVHPADALALPEWLLLVGKLHKLRTFLAADILHQIAGVERPVGHLFQIVARVHGHRVA